MSFWPLALVVVAAGAVGGFLNALVYSRGFVMPHPIKDEQVTIWHPGFLGNILVGGFAAIISWGLYGPANSVPVFGSSAGLEPSSLLTFATLAGAALVGLGGARWIMSEVDKQLLKSTASSLAAHGTDPSVTRQIMLARPREAFEIAKAVRDGSGKTPSDNRQ